MAGHLLHIMHFEMSETPRGAPQGAGSADAEASPLVAYVLGGGGDLGANEVGMLRALLERGILPDLIVGSSIGAINGAAIAAEPSLQMLDRLEAVWRRPSASPAPSSGSVRTSTLACRCVAFFTASCP